MAAKTCIAAKNLKVFSVLDRVDASWGSPFSRGMEGTKYPIMCFSKWYKDTRKQVVEVQVEGMPSVEITNESLPSSTSQIYETSVRIWIEFRMSSGLHLSRKNLSYQELVRMVEKTEGYVERDRSEPIYFYYVRNFTYMRCKYSRVLSIIRERFHHEPAGGDVFVILNEKAL